jgi:transposase
MRGFKIANASIGKPLREARECYQALLEQRRKLPARVPVRDASQEAVVKLATERKHLTNLVKMVAYQAESDLLSLLRPHYTRADQEGRTLVHEVLAAAADIHVEDGRLSVTLASLSSPHRNAAVHAICQTLNETDTVFPGTKLRLRYDVHPPPDNSLAFPGPRTRLAPHPEPDNSREG